MRDQMQGMKPEEIHSFVQNIMGNLFESHSSPNSENFMKNFHPFQNASQTEHTREQTKPDYSLFETHDHIYIRLQIPSEELLKQLRLTHTSSVLTLQNFPEIGDEHKIPLPALVKKKGTSAHFKDDILQIKLSKSVDLQFSEVEITEDYL
jgi:HSP20 family molecular chaperone IbpA